MKQMETKNSLLCVQDYRLKKQMVEQKMAIQLTEIILAKLPTTLIVI